MGQKENPTDKTRKVRVLNAAFQDIEDITDFIAIANQQELNVIKVRERIWQTITKSEQNPFAVRECKQIPTKTNIPQSCLFILVDNIQNHGNRNHYTGTDSFSQRFLKYQRRKEK